MADRIRVDEIPGGAPDLCILIDVADDGIRHLHWRGLTVPLDDEIEGEPIEHEATFEGLPYACIRPLDHRDLEGACVDLSDPLGLVGVAARVADRLGDDAPPTAAGLWRLADWLAEQPWFPIRARGMVNSEIIVVAAQYLALTDRLCAVVGLEREGHEVASLKPDISGPGGWWFQLGPDVDETAQTKLFFAGHEGDWLTTLRTALASVEGA